MKPWKRVRVVVDVPVQVHEHHNFTEKDLAWAVARAMESDGFWQDRKYLPKEQQPIFGRVQVKQFNKVMASRT